MPSTTPDLAGHNVYRDGLLDKWMLEAVGDVTGKSVSGALVMTAAKSVFRLLSEEKMAVSEIMNRANLQIKKDITKAPVKEPSGAEEEEYDEKYDEALALVTKTRQASISMIQRHLRIGYNRAARMVETMEEVGIVGALQANGSREVLVPPPPGDE